MKFLIFLLLIVSPFIFESDAIVSSPANTSDSIQQESKVLTDSNRVDNTQIEVEKWETVFEKTGASWYGEPYHGRRTASGPIYNMYEYTFARKTTLGKAFKFGKEYKITNLSNGKSVMVICNDTGPLQPGVDIDLSYQAMKDLNGIKAGKIKVKIEKLKD